MHSNHARTNLSMKLFYLITYFQKVCIHLLQYAMVNKLENSKLTINEHDIGAFGLSYAAMYMYTKPFDVSLDHYSWRVENAIDIMVLAIVCVAYYMHTPSFVDARSILLQLRITRCEPM